MVCVGAFSYSLKGVDMAKNPILEVWEFQGKLYPVCRTKTSGRYYVLIGPKRQVHYPPNDSGLSEEDQKDLDKVRECWDKNILPMALMSAIKKAEKEEKDSE
jgi:hypothetical protein